MLNLFFKLPFCIFYLFSVILVCLTQKKYNMNSSFTFSIIFLAGGQGQRFGSLLPKQYHMLGTKPLAMHSLDVLLQLPYEEAVVVCDPLYRDLFCTEKKTLFTSSGETRQGSVNSGFKALTKPCDVLLIHDSARPFISKEQALLVARSAFEHGAAALGIKALSTYKLCNENNEATQTVDRDHLWEIQTPQALTVDLYEKGISKAQELGIVATDDVMLAELLGVYPKIISGSSKTFKVTSLQDLNFASFLLRDYDEKEI